MQLLITSFVAALLSSTLNLASAAELLGCDAAAVNCTRGQNTPDARCKVGNSTLNLLGIANFTTTLEKSPLTWTYGWNDNGDAISNKSLRSLDRNFYLGIPPSFSLKDTTGCALFFESASANTRPKIEDKFTCGDVLNESCVNDVISQAKTEGKNIDGTSDFCSQLQKIITNKPPTSCSFLTTGNWGNVISQPLTGDSAAKPETLDTCKVTTGQNYNVSLILSNRKEVAYGDMSVLSKIMPIMTFFRKGQDTDASMTCLKLVNNKAGTTSDVPGGNSDQKGAAGAIGPVFFNLAVSVVTIGLLI